MARRKTNATHRHVARYVGVRNGRAHGKALGTRVNISSGSPQDISVLIGQAIEDNNAGFHNGGLYELLFVLQEHAREISNILAHEDWKRRRALAKVVKKKASR